MKMNWDESRRELGYNKYEYISDSEKFMAKCYYDENQEKILNYFKEQRTVSIRDAYQYFILDYCPINIFQFKYMIKLIENDMKLRVVSDFVIWNKKSELKFKCPCCEESFVENDGEWCDLCNLPENQNIN